MNNKRYNQSPILKDKDILLHYAKVLKNKNVEEILKKGKLQSSEEAHELASFFWKMVDQTVIDSDKNLMVAGYTNLESLCEDLMQNLRSHFITTGYTKIWDDEADKD
jgi:hypothetical protein